MKRLKTLLTHPVSLLWVAAAYLPFLSRMSVPLTGDQKVYLATSMEMWLKNSWLQPLLFGKGSYYKPPIQYWATLTGWNVFGFNGFGALIFSVVAAIASCFLVAEISILLGVKREHTRAGLILGAALGTLIYGTTAQMEIYVVFFYLFCFWLGLNYLKAPQEERNSAWLYAAFFFAGVSGLVKSPLYSVYWVLGFTTYLLWIGEWSLFAEKKFYRALALGIVASAIWYLAIFYKDGAQFWADYAVRETWNKKAGNHGTALEIWYALLYFSIPWVFLILPALRRVRIGRKRNRLWAFIVSGSLWPALFFTLYPYRIKPYLFIVLPMLVLAIDYAWAKSGRSGLFKKIFTLTGFVFGGALLFLGVFLFRAGFVSGFPASGLTLAGLLVISAGMATSLEGLAIASLTAMLFFRIAAAELGEKDIADLREFMKKNHEVSFLDERKNIWNEVGLLSIAVSHPLGRIYDLDQAVAVLQSGGAVALSQEQFDEFEVSIEAKLAGLGDLRKVLKGNWSRWKTRAGFPFMRILKGEKLSPEEFTAATKRNYYFLSL